MANKKFLNPINLVNLASDPSSASEGDIYYNTTSDAVKVYANSAWIAIGSGGGTTVSATAPASPATGSAWYKNDTGEFYIYDGTYWVEVNGVIDGATTLNGLTDVTIASPADNEVLAYDDFSGTWINQTSLEAGLLDTSATEQTKTGNLIITGNLTVNGTTTTINSTAINVNNQVIFEGATPNNFETTLTSIDPTADNTISLPNASGTIALQSGYTNDSVITIRSYDGITDGAINLEGYLNKIQLSDDDGVTVRTGGATKAFIFNNSGNITLPGSIVFTDASSQSTAFLGISSYDTDDISEGTRLYYTDERAQDAIGNSVGTGLSYNDSTGTISNPGVLDIIGTANEIVITGTNTQLQVGIPDSPIFVTPNIGAATATSVTVGGAIVKTTTTTISSTAATTIATFPITSGNCIAVECIVLISSTSNGSYTSSKVLITADPDFNTVADITEYAIIKNNDYDLFPVLTATISGSNVLLRAAVSNATATTAKVVSTSILSPQGAA
jgi:hypothetical protein